MKHTLLNKLILFISLIGVCVLLLISHYSYSIERDKYLHFYDIDGLPRNIVTCIEQDKYGYTWIGTGNGVARFDGNNFYNYKALEGFNINDLYIDNQNNLYVSCDEGLYSYNRLNDVFELKRGGFARKVIVHENKVYIAGGDRILTLSNSGTSKVIIAGDLWDFYIEKDGIWASNGKDGVRFYSRESSYKNVSQKFLKGRHVELIRKIDNSFFFSCRNGELYILKKDEKLSKVPIEVYTTIREIIKVDDEIWLATDGDGIIILDSDANFVKSIRKDSNQSSNLNSNSIYDIYLGNNNEVWIGTYSAGLICLQENNSPFNNIVPEARNQNSLIDKEGTAVFLKNNKIYFGTNYGMSILNEGTGKFANYTMRTIKKDLQDVKVLAINQDNSDNIWIGTYGGLLGKYTPDMKLIKSYHPCSSNPNEMQRIVLIHNYSNKNLLIGTHYRFQSLLNFNLKTGESLPFSISHLGDHRKDYQIVSIRKIKNGETIVLTRSAGLFTVNISNNTLDNELPEINKRVTFRLNDFYHDKHDFYWLATQKEGLIRMSEDGLTFDKWGMEQGLPSNTLVRLESIDDKYLWISTISGLCRFDMETEQILVFDHRHDLPANEFTRRTSTVTDDGRLIFGSNAGFTIVDPDKIREDISESKVIISDITFQNQSIKHIQNKSYLNKPLEETERIKLPYNRNSFTIHFFSKDKDLPQYNNYQYRLLGLEDDFIYLGETKHTTYTNLLPGTYTFEVKGTNKSNVWSNTPTQLIIEITPPWYLSWYAFVAYFLMLFAIIFSGLFAYTNRVRLKKEIEISDYKVQTEHELTEKKLAFFTNISHDLKTPLTLIDAPINDLLDDDKLNEKQKNKLLVAQRNSKRLYKLISDLLDFRKLTQKQLPLKVSETEIEAVIENIYESFKTECDKKSIDFERIVSVKQPVFVETNKIEKIIWNLLSNAIKFTESDGEIFLSAERIIIDDKAYLKLSVKDSGIGIENEEKEKIFNRFYQKKDKGNSIGEGTGIGLSIVKDLVELHHGEIVVDSSMGSGSTFTITIPVEKSEYAENEIAASSTELSNEIEKKLAIINNEVSVTNSRNNQYNLPSLLLVEDNVELREYLAQYFGADFKVYEAVDGADGLEKVNQKKPDVIITDVLMPNMDGYEFCKEVRSNFDTSHLPIIMLTANSVIEHQIRGLSVGADAYITKPFDINLLKTTVHSTLNNRKKIRTRIMNAGEIDDSENKLTPKDIEFIDKLKSCINENISNQNLNIELLAEHFAISRTQLNRKIKSLTGQTPNNLIRSVRLKKAYEIIKKDGVRVSEAAYRTGFADPNYFTICFKKEFGINPSKI
jgi:signal transduction histidine kinase/DNA-binding response OmpR family regulator/ligand-binding sensor domain-containing protein